MNLRRLGLLLAAAAPLASLPLLGCPGGGPVPETDVCRSPAASGSLTAVSPRHVESSAALVDGDVLPLTIGGQGTPMIGLELILEGDDVPSCAAQHTTVVRSDGMILAESTRPISTYDRPDGSRVSGEMWVIVGFETSPGTEATVRVESYGTMSETTVFLDGRP